MPSRAAEQPASQPARPVFTMNFQLLIAVSMSEAIHNPPTGCWSAQSTMSDHEQNHCASVVVLLLFLRGMSHQSGTKLNTKSKVFTVHARVQTQSHQDPETGSLGKVYATTGAKSQSITPSSISSSSPSNSLSSESPSVSATMPLP
jgi:hypothetical protein